MSHLGHFQPTLRVSAAVRCLLFPESDLLAARQRNGDLGDIGQRKPLKSAGAFGKYLIAPVIRARHQPV
jgi:hypothetical protein